MKEVYLSVQQIKEMDMVTYLETLGYAPQKIRGNDYWYLSPLHVEKSASFKVNRKLNAWYDHALGRGGNLVDFGILYHQCSVKELLEKFSILSFHPRPLSLDQHLTPASFADEKKEPGDSKIVLLETRELAQKSLLDYLGKRNIPLDIARPFCKEVDFLLYSKKHTVIGFQNSAGGFELRGPDFKGSSSPKDSTFICNAGQEIAVFEGFFSYLSFLSIGSRQGEPLPDFLVLNSLSFFERSRDIMEQYLRIHLYLDRDAAGIRCTQSALKWDRQRYTDRSILYQGHKDVNNWLIHHTNSRKEGLRMKIRF